MPLLSAICAETQAAGSNITDCQQLLRCDQGVRHDARNNIVMKAIWNDEVIAESNETIVVEGNHYFPFSSVNDAFLKPSSTTTVCSWKGTAHYYSLSVAGAENSDAAWYYPNPKDAAQKIAGRVAFWKGVQIVD